MSKVLGGFGVADSGRPRRSALDVVQNLLGVFFRLHRGRSCAIPRRATSESHSERQCRGKSFSTIVQVRPAIEKTR